MVYLIKRIIERSLLDSEFFSSTKIHSKFFSGNFCWFQAIEYFFIIAFTVVICYN